MNYQQAFNKAFANLGGDEDTRREWHRQNRVELARAIEDWLQLHGYTVEQFLADDQIAQECVVDMLRPL